MLEGMLYFVILLPWIMFIIVNIAGGKMKYESKGLVGHIAEFMEQRRSFANEKKKIKEEDVLSLDEWRESKEGKEFRRNTTLFERAEKEKEVNKRKGNEENNLLL